MRYTEFTIKNFKGIRDEKLRLDVVPGLKIFTLVGLNESGKTTIMEAISSFQNGIKDTDKIIPKDKKLNFNESISVSATLELDKSDEDAIKSQCQAKSFVLTEDINKISVEKKIEYKDSKPQSKEPGSTWTINLKGYKAGSRKKNVTSLHDTDRELWQEIVSQITKSLFPKIILYSNFLFEIPPRIYLAKKNKDETTTPKYLLATDDPYYLLTQDILDSLEQGLQIEPHLLNRFLAGEPADIDNITHVLNAMSAKVTVEVFQTWGHVSGINVDGREVSFGDAIKDDNEGYYLELKVKEGSKTYSVQERSLGFRWFFAFLLFTQFRKFRSGDPKNTLFLLDEPASNLHQTGQQELLTLLETLTDRATVIYSTHSHHLISPKWLSGAYIVKNEAVNPAAKAISDVISLRSTDIKLDRYFNFAAQNPNQDAHFQPILDVLQYRPSALELIPEIVIVEGKFDFYNFSYYSFCQSLKLNFYPGNGAGSLSEIIALYLSWGRKFVVMLDADSAGHREKTRYLNEFGEILNDRIFCLDDVDSRFNNITTEFLTNQVDKDNLVKDVYGATASYDKKLFNTALQKKYIDGDKFTFSTETNDNFKMVTDFLSSKLS